MIDTPQQTLSIEGLRELCDTARATQRHWLECGVEALNADPRAICEKTAVLLGMGFGDSATLHEMDAAFHLWPLARAHQTLAVLAAEGASASSTEQTQVTHCAILTDPFDGDLATQLEQATGGPVRYMLAVPDDLRAYLSQQEGHRRAVDALGAGVLSAGQAESEHAEELTLAKVESVDSIPVKLVNSTLFDALRTGASDVHLETTPGGMSVKYRIDGVLDHAATIQGRALAEQAISRLKVLAELDIAERRTPQDGSFQVSALGRAIDLRVSIMPSIHGEDAVVRILDKQAMIEAHGRLTLDALGFQDDALAMMRCLIALPYGMLLVTGPTGSGKTTTLYAALAESNTGREKVITIEDPVEYQLPGVLQIPVNEKKGLTFARGLRSILRHDPDKIMVGEIRDRETAEIAVQSALTGHLVLSTVHANSVFDVFGRFTHMGLDPYALVSALNGIWAQRLLRVNCPHCSAAYVPETEELERCRIPAGELDRYLFRKGRGCGDCRGTGYRGRRAIAEFLTLDDEIREAIVQQQPTRVIKELARTKGTRSLAEAARELVQRGMTTLEEVSRVTLVQ